MTPIVSVPSVISVCNLSHLSPVASPPPLTLPLQSPPLARPHGLRGCLLLAGPRQNIQGHVFKYFAFGLQLTRSPKRALGGRRKGLEGAACVGCLLAEGGAGAGRGRGSGGDGACLKRGDGEGFACGGEGGRRGDEQTVLERP